MPQRARFCALQMLFLVENSLRYEQLSQEEFLDVSQSLLDTATSQARRCSDPRRGVPTCCAQSPQLAP